MSDDPNKRGKDGDTVSWQSWEIDYVADQLKQEHPNKSREEILRVIHFCKAAIQPSEGREKLMACARRSFA